MSKKEKVTFEMLIAKLRELDEGTYDNNRGISIDIKGNKNDFFAQIKNSNRNIDINCDGFEEDITLQLNEYARLHINIREDLQRKYSFIFVEKDNKKYEVYERGISGYNIPYASVNGNKMLFKESENCYLEYCFEDFSIYVYYRKYNSTKDHSLIEDLNLNFVKFEYNQYFLGNIERYNSELTECIEKIKNKYKSTIYEPLVNSISLSEIEYKNLSNKIDSLLELVTVYNAYKDKFNLEQYESEIEEVYNFVVSLINNPMEAGISNLQNLISNTNLYDKEALKKLRSEIDTVLKTSNKTKKKVKQ